MEANDRESPVQSESIDDSGEDTQLRFHYQAQRIACLAISLIVSQPKNARIYCELHEDGLVKHWDRTYTGYQFKSRERNQRKFRATEKVVLKAVRNFARLHKRFGIRIREFVIASNHAFAGDNDKNDLRLLVKVASEGSAISNAHFLEFWQSFSQQYPGFTQADIISVLGKVRVEDNEPDFNAALAAVVEELRTVPDLSGVDQPTLLNCAHALISKVEECSRKHVLQSVGEDDEEHAHAKSSIKKKLLTADIVWNVLQSAVRMPLGTSFRRIAVQSVPIEYIPVVKSAFASSGDSLKSTKRELADGTKFSRKELQELVQCASVSSANRISLLLGEPGSGKSALLADLCDDLSRRGITVLAVKCEDIPKDVQDQAKLAEFLGLPYAAAPCFNAIADSEPVVLVVDQLDAIGALWDTQTGRMQAVLALVHMVSKIANARVILSCREFDARFDVRISNLDACEVMLVLPSHDEVKGVLSAHGLDCSQWPPDVMDVLRNPQHLDIFVNLLKDASNQITVVKTYLDLLGLLWSRRVQPDDERVLSKLCDLIGDRKQLFVPAVELNSERKSLDRLSGAGVLKFANNENNITRKSSPKRKIQLALD